MRIALVRHGDSLPSEMVGGRDAERYLSERGRSQARAVGKLLEEHSVAVGRAWTSSLVRAVQTTELILSSLGSSDAPVQTLSDLAGGSLGEVMNQAAILDTCPDHSGTLLIVGHQPQMGQLLATLLGHRTGLPFRTGMVAVLEGQPQPAECKLVGIGLPELSEWHTDLNAALSQ